MRFLHFKYFKSKFLNRDAEEDWFGSTFSDEYLLRKIVRRQKVDVCVVLPDRKKDLSKMKSLLNILTDPTIRYRYRLQNFDTRTAILTSEHSGFSLLKPKLDTDAKKNILYHGTIFFLIKKNYE